MYLILQKPGKDPYFNIAAEEYFFKSFGSPVFSVWENDESIVVGKHQNAIREINYPWTEQNNIPVIRRITGGGTVYHGPGNINFSFIFHGNPENLVDFRDFIRPVIKFLRKMGVPAEFREKSNIVANGKKISGNSAHVFKGKVLYHGTLLYNARMDRLKQALRRPVGYYNDRAVDSAPVPVGNIRSYLPPGTSANDLMNSFQEFVLANFKGSKRYELSKTDIDNISKLADEKYRRWEWNFGYSPRYSMERTVSVGNSQEKIILKVEKGIIRYFEITGQVLPDTLKELLWSSLPGTRHELRSLKEKIEDLTDGQNGYENLDQLVEKMF